MSLETQKTWRDLGGPGRKRFPYMIQGSSVAADHTMFTIPELGNLQFDAGMKSRSRPGAVFITHTHPDHCQELAKNCMNQPSSFNIFCPPEAEKPLQEYLRAVNGLRACSTRVQWNSALCSGKIVPIDPEKDGWLSISQIHARSITPSKKKQADTSSLKHKMDDDPAVVHVPKRLREAPPQTLAELQSKQRANEAPKRTNNTQHPDLPAVCEKLFVKGIRLRHSVPTLGYVIAEERKRLLPEYAARRKADPEAFAKEIASLRKSKTIIDGYVKVPLLAFVCDCTSESAVETIRRLCLDSTPPQVIMVECTFIQDEDAVQAQKRKHVLWSKLCPVTQEFPLVVFLLIHFSHRYKDEGVLGKFAAGLPSNVHAFL